MESFFATLECELLDRYRFPTRTAARMAVFDFIEGFYNTRRRHSALGYCSPTEYERRWTTTVYITEHVPVYLTGATPPEGRTSVI